MSTTDITVLNEILKESREQLFPELGENDFFEFFAAQQVLRDRQLDPDDIQSGIVGGDDSGSDGGIDGFYLLVNGRLIRDDVAAENLRTLKQNIQMELVILQATTHAGFTLDRITRLKDTIEDVFTLDRTEFSENYSDSLRDAIGRFRTAHRVLASKFPTFTVNYFLVTKGDIAELASDVRGTANDLEAFSKTLLATVTAAKFTFVGARALIELASKPPKVVFSLKCVDSASSGKDAYIALVRLTEYLRFIRSEKGELLANLFESNVRDYQGDVSVNELIRETLERPVADEQFWWLNNGITIVAEKLGGHPKELVIEEPQIVNGLQTSQEIFNYFVSHPGAEMTDQREVLIRVVGSSNIETHDHIIRATNSQTSIPPASLWATDSIHRDIEKVFRSSGLYYDRRKNSWRR
jgi:AIPR protein